MTNAPKKERRPKERVDALLVARGLCDTRARAQALIVLGEVFSGEERVDKPGHKLPDDAPLRIREQQKYVSRGGLKLEGALEDLAFSPEGMRVVDVGASTGGFTDCVLQNGAQLVYAVDVGHGQLAQKLRTDARVVVLEETNAKALSLELLGGAPVDLAVVDASFISLEKLLDGISRVLRREGHLLALIKPQFEVGREEATKSAGVIRDEKVRREAIDRVIESVRASGYEILGDHRCRVPGPKGNVEHFVLARRS